MKKVASAGRRSRARAKTNRPAAGRCNRAVNETELPSMVVVGWLTREMRTPRSRLLRAVTDGHFRTTTSIPPINARPGIATPAISW